MAQLEHSETQSPPPRRRRHSPNDDREPRHDRKDRPIRSGEKDERRHRRRPRSRDSSRERRRSRTPEPSGRRTRDRGRDRSRSKERDGYRTADRFEHQDRGHSRDRHRDRRRRRSGEDRERGKNRDSHYRRHRRDGEGDDKQARKLIEDRKSPIKRGGPLPSQEASFAVTNGEEPEQPKEKANYSNTGALAAASNSVTQADGSTVTLKYHEPAEARKPSPRDQWKLFVFKGADVVDTIDLSVRSCWLVGRDQAVVDLPAEHPSISKQHAVLQFRYTEKRNEFGDKIGKVKPYLIDLESANGTTLNDDKVPDRQYLELRDKDIVQFGHSTREYVVMLAPRD